MVIFVFRYINAAEPGNSQHLRYYVRNTFVFLITLISFNRFYLPVIAALFWSKVFLLSRHLTGFFRNSRKSSYIFYPVSGKLNSFYPAGYGEFSKPRFSGWKWSSLATKNKDNLIYFHITLTNNFSDNDFLTIKLEFPAWLGILLPLYTV